MSDGYQFQDDSHEHEFSEFSDIVKNQQEEDGTYSFLAFEDENGKMQVEEMDPFDLAGDARSVAKSLRETSDKESVAKNFDHSRQSHSEIDQPSITNTNIDSKFPLIEPPYDPNCFARFLNCSELNAACVDRKVVDSVARKYEILPKFPVRKDDSEDANDQDVHGNFARESDFIADCMAITEFIKNVDDCEDFEDITKKVAMDHEAIGWGAYEVYRNITGKISKLKRLPATRIKVLRGNKGYVEELTNNYFETEGARQYRYYQPFGSKVVVKNTFDIDGQTFEDVRNYDPELDGELDMMNNESLSWNLKAHDNYEDLPFSIENFQEEAATEILFLPKTHSNTRYYGYTDAVPAVGAILANNLITQATLKFLENDCIPRFVIMVEGAKPDSEFKKQIRDYFENRSGQNSSLMFLPSTGMRQPKVTFHKIQTSRQEADFLETRHMNDQLILIAHKVPPAMVGIQDAASLGSGKGMAQAEVYKDRTIMPAQRYWARQLNKLFRLGLGVRWAEIKFDELDIRDRLQEAQIFQIHSQMGTLNINEIREIMGKPPIVGGDCYFLKVREGGMVKVEDLPNLSTEEMLSREFDTTQDPVETPDNTQEDVEELQKTVIYLREELLSLAKSAKIGNNESELEPRIDNIEVKLDDLIRQIQVSS